MPPDADAPGAQHDEEVQASPPSSKRFREDDLDYGGTHYSPSSHIETIVEMKNARLDYDERDEGDYEPAPKRTRVDKRDDDHVDFYDDKPRLPRHQRRREASRSPSRSRARGRPQNYRSSRSPVRGPSYNHTRNTNRSRSRSRSRSHSQTRSRSRDRRRSRSRARRHDRSPRDRRGSNARAERGPARYHQGGRPGGGSRSFPEASQRDVVRPRQDVTQEDRKRGQRLFGGLLANLRGPATGPRSAPGRGPAGQRGAQLAGVETANDKSSLFDRQRPQSASGKADSEDKMQTDEDDCKTTERLANLEHARKIEQVRLDEKKMHALQASDIALARYLRTESRPQVYYQPQDLSSKQADTIKGQIRDAEQRAAQQLAAFEAEKTARLSALGVKYTPTSLAAADKAHGPPEQTRQDVRPTAEAALDNTPMHDQDAMVDDPATATTTAPEKAKVKSTSPHANRLSVEMDDRPEEIAAPIDEAEDQRVLQGGPQQHQYEEADDHHDDRDIMVETEEDAVIY